MSIPLSAQLQISPPQNLNQVRQAIQSSLNGVRADINVAIKQGSLNNISSLNNNINNLQSNINKIPSSINKANRSFVSFSDNIAVSTRRMTAFIIGLTAVSKIENAFFDAAKSALEFQHELVRLGQIGNDTRNDIASISNEVGRLSKAFGTFSGDLLKSASTLRQAGFNIKETVGFLETLAKTTLAPTFDNLEQTTEGAIAIMNQFGSTINDSSGKIAFLEKSLGAINKVSARYAVESSDLIGAVQRTGGAFEAAGGNLNELIGIMTSIRSSTRESAETIATALRTIFGRLQRTDTVERLSQLGVQLRITAQEAARSGKEIGEFVGPYRAIQEIGKALENVPRGSVVFAQIAEEIGGIRQLSKVIPLLKEYKLAREATLTAERGSFSLDADAVRAQQSLAVQLSKTAENFRDLFRTLADNDPLKEFISTSLKAVNALIEMGKVLKPLVPLFLTLGGFKIGQLGTDTVRKLIGGAGGIPSASITGGKYGYASGGTVKRFNTGGPVPGHMNTDSIPSLLTPGEYVFSKKAAQKIGYAKLNKMNRAGYARGGKVKPKMSDIIKQMGDYEDIAPTLDLDNYPNPPDLIDPKARKNIDERIKALFGPKMTRNDLRPFELGSGKKSTDESSYNYFTTRSLKETRKEKRPLKLLGYEFKKRNVYGKEIPQFKRDRNDNFEDGIINTLYSEFKSYLPKKYDTYDFDPQNKIDPQPIDNYIKFDQSRGGRSQERYYQNQIVKKVFGEQNIKLSDLLPFERPDVTTSDITKRISKEKDITLKDFRSVFGKKPQLDQLSKNTLISGLGNGITSDDLYPFEIPNNKTQKLPKSIFEQQRFSLNTQKELRPLKLLGHEFQKRDVYGNIIPRYKKDIIRAAKRSNQPIDTFEFGSREPVAEFGNILFDNSPQGQTQRRKYQNQIVKNVFGENFKLSDLRPGERPDVQKRDVISGDNEVSLSQFRQVFGRKPRLESDMVDPIDSTIAQVFGKGVTKEDLHPSDIPTTSRTSIIPPKRQNPLYLGRSPEAFRFKILGSVAYGPDQYDIDGNRVISDRLPKKFFGRSGRTYDTRKRYQTGGSVFRGFVPGVGNGDTYPAELEEGSFVLRKAAVEAFKPSLMSEPENNLLSHQYEIAMKLKAMGGMGATLRKYSKGGIVQKFKEGGTVPGIDNEIRRILKNLGLKDIDISGIVKSIEVNPELLNSLSKQGATPKGYFQPSQQLGTSGQITLKDISKTSLQETLPHELAHALDDAGRLNSGSLISGSSSTIQSISERAFDRFVSPNKQKIYRDKIYGNRYDKMRSVEGFANLLQRYQKYQSSGSIGKFRQRKDKDLFNAYESVILPLLQQNTEEFFGSAPSRLPSNITNFVTKPINFGTSTSLQPSPQSPTPDILSSLGSISKSPNLSSFISGGSTPTNPPQPPNQQPQFPNNLRFLDVFRRAGFATKEKGDFNPLVDLMKSLGFNTFSGRDGATKTLSQRIDFNDPKQLGFAQDVPNTLSNIGKTFDIRPDQINNLIKYNRIGLPTNLDPTNEAFTDPSELSSLIGVINQLQGSTGTFQDTFGKIPSKGRSKTDITKDRISQINYINKLSSFSGGSFNVQKAKTPLQSLQQNVPLSGKLDLDSLGLKPNEVNTLGGISKITKIPQKVISGVLLGKGKTKRSDELRTGLLSSGVLGVNSISRDDILQKKNASIQDLEILAKGGQSSIERESLNFNQQINDPGLQNLIISQLLGYRGIGRNKEKLDATSLGNLPINPSNFSRFDSGVTRRDARKSQFRKDFDFLKDNKLTRSIGADKLINRGSSLLSGFGAGLKDKFYTEDDVIAAREIAEKETLEKRASGLIGEDDFVRPSVSKTGYKQNKKIGLSRRLGRLPGKISRGLGKFSAGLSGSALGIGIGAQLLAQQLPDNTSSDAGFKGSLQYGSTGALVGSAFGPQGVALGALTGGIYGATKGLEDFQKKLLEKDFGKALESLDFQLTKLSNNFESFDSSKITNSFNKLQKNLEKKRNIDVGFIGDDDNRRGFTGNAVRDSVGNRLDYLVSYVSNGFSVAGADESTNAKTQQKLDEFNAVQGTPVVDRIFQTIERASERTNAKDFESFLKENDGLVVSLLNQAGQLSSTPGELLSEEAKVTYESNKRETERSLSVRKSIFEFNSLSKAINSVVVQFSNLNDNLGSTTLFEGVSTRQSNLSSTVDFFGTANVKGFEKGINTLTSVIGSNGLSGQFTSTALQSNKILPNLVSVIGSTLQRDPSVDASVAFRENIEKFTPGLSKEFVDQLVAVAGTQLNEADFAKRFRNNPAEIATNLLSDSFPNINETLSNVFKNLDSISNDFQSNVVRTVRFSDDILSSRNRSEELRGQSDRFRVDNLAFASGRSNPLDFLSLNQLRQPFINQQANLSGLSADRATDPLAISGALSNTLELIRTRQQESSQTTDFREQLKINEELIRLQSTAGRLRQSLENLTDTSKTTAAAQEKLSQIQNDRQSRLGFVENFLSSDLSGRQEINRAANLTSIAAQQGTLRNIDASTGGVGTKEILSFLNSLGSSQLPGLGGIRANDLKNQLLAEFGGGIVDAGGLNEQEVFLRQFIQEQLNIANTSQNELTSLLSDENTRFNEQLKANLVSTLGGIHADFASTLSQELKNANDVVDIRPNQGFVGPPKPTEDDLRAAEAAINAQKTQEALADPKIQAEIKALNGITSGKKQIRYRPVDGLGGSFGGGLGGIPIEEPAYKKLFGLESGGKITGGTYGKDSIPAMLAGGEYVVNAQSASQNMDILEAINSGKKPIRMANGGLTPRSKFALRLRDIDEEIKVSQQFMEDFQKTKQNITTNSLSPMRQRSAVVPQRETSGFIQRYRDQLAQSQANNQPLPKDTGIDPVTADRLARSKSVSVGGDGLKSFSDERRQQLSGVVDRRRKKEQDSIRRNIDFVANRGMGSFTQNQNQQQEFHMNPVQPMNDSSFKNSVGVLNNSFQIFQETATELAKVLSNLSIQVERNGKIEVVVNGAEVLARIRGDLEVYIRERIAEAIKPIKDKQGLDDRTPTI